MQQGSPRLLWGPAIAFSLVLFAHSGFAKPKTEIEIGSGPKVISEEERAIQPDPSSGAEHGVILVEETERNEDAVGVETATRYHLRAKILSNEGRDLANVEIPYSREDTRLESWWGRTLLPDGTVLELPESEIKKQSIAKSTRGEIGTMKAALPGVVPGCVIDYGYVLRDNTYNPYYELTLARLWPVRKLRYRWQPFHLFNAAYRATRTEGGNIEITRDGHSVLVVGHDLPAVKDEPLMPPSHETRASVAFYYYEANTDFKDFWNMQAKRIERRVKSFHSRSQPIEDAIASMKIPPEADLSTKLKTAYDWIGSHVKNTQLRSSEEIELEDPDDKSETDSAKRVLEAKEGSSRQLDSLFIGFARKLGAEANLVMVTDRTSRYWDTELRSMHQFETSLVAVRSPGEPDEKVVLVDPGSGLPYGEIPWWVTGTKGLLATSDGARAISLPPSRPNRNVSDTKAELVFSTDNEEIVAHWTQTWKGQVGMDERRSLRGMTPDERKKRIDRLCGEWAETEVVTAEAPGLEDPNAGYGISCETRRSGTNLEEGVGMYRLGFVGAWLEEVPDLPAGPRTLPVVFPFPRTDVLIIDVAAPSGFAPTTEPPPVRLTTPYGSYLLSIAVNEKGYRVQRSVTLVPLALGAEMYGSIQSFFGEIRRSDRTLLEFKRVSEGG